MLNWLTTIFKSAEVDANFIDMNKFLIVGLGNIGAEYAETRHNIGFKILDYFAKYQSISFDSEKYGSVAQCKYKGKTVLLLKPNTYMNLSGNAVKYWMQKEKITAENILIITDDLNLEFGSIRIRQKGSDGGHNGLKSINQLLNTTEYPRFRFGISDAFKKGQQVNYVLGEWTPAEKSKLIERFEVADQIIKSFVTAGLSNTMTAFNGK
jgi:peptidyl-tRNA hydrolase, PTH1 family